jgi:hypothetical protein
VALETEDAAAAAAGRHAAAVETMQCRLEEATRTALEQQLLVQDRIKMLDKADKGAWIPGIYEIWAV